MLTKKRREIFSSISLKGFKTIFFFIKPRAEGFRVYGLGLLVAAPAPILEVLDGRPINARPQGWPQLGSEDNVPLNEGRLGSPDWWRRARRVEPTRSVRLVTICLGPDSNRNKTDNLGLGPNSDQENLRRPSRLRPLFSGPCRPLQDRTAWCG